MLYFLIKKRGIFLRTKKREKNVSLPVFYAALIACIVDDRITKGRMLPGAQRLKDMFDLAAAETSPKAPKKNNSGSGAKRKPRVAKKMIRLEFDTLSPQDREALDLLGAIIVEVINGMWKKAVTLGKGNALKASLCPQTTKSKTKSRI